ncbi:MAG: HD domain-containing phosphohydrolase [Gaiellaceae bacterium]|jgi:putative nucleotidyltransferase with HDIG domain
MKLVKPIPFGLRSEIRDGGGAYAAILASCAGALAIILLAFGWDLGDAWTVAALCVIAAVSERGLVRLTSTTSQSISILPTLFAAVLFGPLAGMVVGAASLAGEIFQPPHLKWLTYTSSRAISGALTGLAASYCLTLSGTDFLGTAVATLVGAVVAEVLDVVFAAIAAHVRGTRSPWELIRTDAPMMVSSVPLYAPLVTVLAIAYQDLSPLSLLMFFVPALAAQRLFALYQDQRRLADDLRSVNERLERANLSFASALVATLDARDRYTAGHSAAVAIYSRDIAERMGLPDAQQQLAHLCGLVHDIGKIGLPAGLLEKPGALTLEERRLMETHPEIGERILANVDDYAEIAGIVRHHHERFDGNGYPDGLGSDDIPLLARVIAVADAYNAMTSDRPYREAMPSRVARLRLAQAVESQFDTSVVAAFEAILAGAPETYRLAKSADFRLEMREHEQEEEAPPVLALAQ